MDWIKSIAPTIGTALAGPLGGAAASFLADKLGLQKKTIEAVSSVLSGSKMTTEQVMAVKLAELDFEKFLQQNNIDLVKLDMENIKSAREMQIANKSKTPELLTFIVTFGFFGVLFYMLVFDAKPGEVMLIMLGQLGTAWAAVVGFWFGSTAGSTRKTELLSQAQPISEKNESK